jgi:signal peptidase I
VIVGALIYVLVSGQAALVLGWTRGMESYSVGSRSMEPLLFRDSVVFGRPLAPGQGVGRGNLVAFRVGEAPMNGSRDILLKRIVAIPGDRVEVDSQGAVTVWAGTERSQGTTYCMPGEWSEREPQAWMLPEGHYFVLGDNCWQSIDSRSPGIGLVPHEDIEAIILFRQDGRFDIVPIETPEPYTTLPEPPS